MKKQYAISFDMGNPNDEDFIKELFDKCGFSRRITSTLYCTENDGIKSVMQLKENLKKYDYNNMFRKLWSVSIFLIDEITKFE